MPDTGNHYRGLTAAEFFAQYPTPWRWGDAGLLLMDANGRHVAWLGRGGWVDPHLRALLTALPDVCRDAAALLAAVTEASPAVRPQDSANVNLRRTLKKIEGLYPCQEPLTYAI